MTINNLIKIPPTLLERIWQPDQPVFLFSREIDQEEQVLLNKKLNWMVVDNKGRPECTYSISSTFIEFFDVKPRDLDDFDLDCMAHVFFRLGVGLYGVIACYECMNNSYQVLGNLYFLNKTLIYDDENVDSITLCEAIHTSQELIKTYDTQVH